MRPAALSVASLVRPGVPRPEIWPPAASAIQPGRMLERVPRILRAPNRRNIPPISAKGLELFLGDYRRGDFEIQLDGSDRAAFKTRWRSNSVRAPLSPGSSAAIRMPAWRLV